VTLLLIFSFWRWYTILTLLYYVSFIGALKYSLLIIIFVLWNFRVPSSTSSLIFPGVQYLTCLMIGIDFFLQGGYSSQGGQGRSSFGGRYSGGAGTVRYSDSEVEPLFYNSRPPDYKEKSRYIFKILDKYYMIVQPCWNVLKEFHLQTFGRYVHYQHPMLTTLWILNGMVWVFLFFWYG